MSRRPGSGSAPCPERCPRGRSRAASGAATVFGIGLMGLLIVVALVGAGIVGLLDAHRRAEAAADLAALAGGGALVEGRDACDVAAEVAHRNGASLATCRAGTDSVAVVVTVAGPTLLGLAARLPGRARAGPVAAGGAAPQPAG